MYVKFGKKLRWPNVKGASYATLGEGTFNIRKGE